MKDRIAFVREKKLCFSCLQSGHLSKDCKMNLKCVKKGCKKSHNVLLHLENNRTPAKVSASGSPSEISVSSCTVSRARKGALQVLEVGLTKGSSVAKARALCDTGSTHSWISEKLRSQMGLKGSTEVMFVRGVTGSIEGNTRRVDLELFSLRDETFAPLQFSALVRPGLSLGCKKLYLRSIKEACPHLKVVVADLIDYSKIEVILGQDVYSAICPVGYRTSDNHSPWAVQLPIGWVVSGPLPNCKPLQESHCMFSSAETVCSATDSDVGILSAQVAKWCALESYSSFNNVDPRSTNDKLALKILNGSCQFTGSRYRVGLLWKPESDSLSNNFSQAKAHLLSLEKRLEKHPETKTRYAETIKSDIGNGYVRKLPAEEVALTKNDPQWYLPHHPVQSPHKLEKIRRVCNAACKFGGTSLNDVLLPGPDLLADLIGILVRFRLYPVAICADIEAMFMQVEVPENEQKFLRFLWREDVSQEIEVFQYLRHIFGATSSPTCANFIVQKVAHDNKVDFPLASESVLNSFYVDDFLKSFQTVEEAINTMTQLVLMLKRGGFNLSKFVTNSNEVFQSKPENIVFACPFVEVNEISVLGLKWDVKDDYLSVTRGASTNSVDQFTQRKILSALSSVYDSFGYYCSVHNSRTINFERVVVQCGPVLGHSCSSKHK